MSSFTALIASRLGVPEEALRAYGRRVKSQPIKEAKALVIAILSKEPNEHQ